MYIQMSLTYPLLAKKIQVNLKNRQNAKRQEDCLKKF